MKEKSYNEGKSAAAKAILNSITRHKLQADQLKHPEFDEAETEKYNFAKRKLSDTKGENIAKFIKASNNTDKISVKVSDNLIGEKSIEAEFEDDGNMSLHYPKGRNPIVDKNINGPGHNIEPGENSKFYKNATGHNLDKDSEKLKEKVKKEYNLAENLLSDISENIGMNEDIYRKIILNEFEASDDIRNMYGENFKYEGDFRKDFKDIDIVLPEIIDIIDEIKDIKYGFISKIDGCRIVNRDWIHNCSDLSKYYSVQTDPEETIKEKLGICTDQCLAINHLLNKYHPDFEKQMYALTKGRFGHCVIAFSNNKNWFYLENAWDKERGIHGPFSSKDLCEKYLINIYHKHHDADNDDPVNLEKYEDYLKWR